MVLELILRYRDEENNKKNIDKPSTLASFIYAAAEVFERLVHDESPQSEEMRARRLKEKVDNIEKVIEGRR